MAVKSSLLSPVFTDLVDSTALKMELGDTQEHYLCHCPYGGIQATPARMTRPRGPGASDRERP